MLFRGITRKLEYFLCLILLQLQIQLPGYANCPSSKHKSEKKNQAAVQTKPQTLTAGCLFACVRGPGHSFLSWSETWVSGTGHTSSTTSSPSLMHLKCFQFHELFINYSLKEKPFTSHSFANVTGRKYQPILLQRFSVQRMTNSHCLAPARNLKNNKL